MTAGAFPGTNPVTPRVSAQWEDAGITAMILLSLLLGVICRNECSTALTPKPLKSGGTIAVPVEVVSNSRNVVWCEQGRRNRG